MAQDEDEQRPILPPRVLSAHADAPAPPLTRPAPPVPPVGQHPALERRCDAPGCDVMTPHFVATSDEQIIHWCEAHQAWAMERAKAKGWWRA